MGDAERARKMRGAWFTPTHLVDTVVAAVIDAEFVRSRALGGRALRILDPACGDGRFLAAAIDAVRALGAEATGLGVDIDESTAHAAATSTAATVVCADALTSRWLAEQAGTFDLVIGNPPYLSQLAATTSRGGASRRGGGPYADVAVEFVALAADLVDPDGGRVAFVLPQSILSVRDASDVRRDVDSRARLFWSAWTGERDFDAQVVTCALAFEFTTSSHTTSPRTTSPHTTSTAATNWSHVVTDRAGVPPVATVFDTTDPEEGRLGDRVRLNANFRDEYYGMILAVGDHDTGPPLVTSGLIDPGRCLWGERPVRFAKQRFSAPRIDLGALDPKMSRWAAQRLVPKVLIANQTSIIEAVCDPDGAWLPGVPVVSAYPLDPASAVRTAWEVAAVLGAPTVSVWAWHRRGGTGLSSDTIRIGPTLLADLVWPEGSLDAAVAALQAGDVIGSGRLVDAAYGLDQNDRDAASAWWRPTYERIAARASPAP